MKTFASLALCAFLTLSAFAADRIVEVKDTGNTYVDGVNVGQPADAIANNPKIASDIQIALSKFVAKVNKDQADATKAAQDGAAAQVKSAEDAKTAAIEAHTDAKAAEIAALKAEIEKLKEEIAALKAPKVEEAAIEAPAK